MTLTATAALSSCPYRSICPQCPGDIPGELWVPVEGFKKVEKGLATRMRYLQTEKFRLQQQLYRLSEKGVATAQKRKDQKKLFRAAARWVAAHPGKTVNDYLAYLSEMKGGPQ